MASVTPFRALRYTASAGDIAALTCPPYDIVSETQRKAFLARNPYNMIRLELPREGEDVYAAAGQTLADWLSAGVLKTAEKPAFYLYAMDFSVGGRAYSVAGVIGEVALSPFSDGVILPHEETLSKAKEDRFQLMKATDCNFSTIYSLYSDGESKLNIAAFAETAPLWWDMTDGDGVRHRLWAIEDKADCARISAHFADKKLYIADGHHRYETALRYRDTCRAAGAPVGGPADRVMMLLVEMSHPGLVVFPTHRVLRRLPAFDRGALLAGCADYFDMVSVSADGISGALDAAYAAGKTAFGLYTGGDTADLLTLRDPAVMDVLLPALSPASRHLDVTVLHTLILERLLKIDKADMAAQRSLTYTRSLAEALAAVRQGESSGAFLLNPTRVPELAAVAAAGEKMPQKSTYFAPKPITGLVMRRFADADS